MDERSTTRGSPVRKQLVFLKSEIKTPPFTPAGRREAGRLLSRVQDGEALPMPASRPMPNIGSRCHELRVRDAGHYWRIVYRVDADVIVVAGVFPKTTVKTPKPVLALCRVRYARYDAAKKGT